MQNYVFRIDALKFLLLLPLFLFLHAARQSAPAVPRRSASARPCSAENAPQGRLTSPLDDISSGFSYREGEMPLTIGLMKTTWQADVPPRGLWGT